MSNMKIVWVDALGAVIYVQGGKSPLTYREWREARGMETGTVTKNDITYQAPFMITPTRHPSQTINNNMKDHEKLQLCIGITVTPPGNWQPVSDAILVNPGKDGYINKCIMTPTKIVRTKGDDSMILVPELQQAVNELCGAAADGCKFVAHDLEHRPTKNQFLVAVTVALMEQMERELGDEWELIGSEEGT